jgi:hypothetical protein
MTSVHSGAWSSASHAGLGMEAALLALLNDGSVAQNESAKQEIGANSEKLERLRAEVREAVKQAAEARENAGFWGKLSSFFGGDVAKLAQLCAAVAVVVASGGTGAPLVLAGMACLTAAEVGRRAGLDPKLCTALSLAGAGLCFAGGAGVTSSMTKTSAVFTAIGGGAQATGSAAAIVEGHYEAEAQRADAQGQLTQAEQDQVRILIEQALARLEHLQSDSERTYGVTAETIRNQQYGREAVLANI